MKSGPGTFSNIDGQRRASEFIDKLFLALSVVYLIYCMKGLTMFKPVIPTGFQTKLMLLMELTVLAKLILRRRGGHEIWLGLLLVATCAMTFLSMGNRRMLFCAILVFGFEGIDHRRILKTYFVAVGGTLLATIIAGLAGGIPNLVYIREGMRSCWGTAYPTDFSTAVLFLAMAMWIAWPKLPNWAMLLFGLIPLALALFITGSRNSLMCSVLFEMMIGYRWFENSVVERLGNTRKRKILRRTDALLMAVLPLCIVAFFLLVFLYAKNPEAMGRVDALTSERIKLTVEGLKKYGITAFGTKIDMNGGRGSSVFPKGEFFFLDSSYAYMLMCYGWITTLAVLGIWEWMLHKAIRVDNRRMAMVMALVAVHSVMEHHFIDVFDNILVAMPLAILSVGDKEEKQNEARKHIAALGGVIGILLVLGILCLPWLMSCLRTIYGAKAWQGGGENAYPVLLLNLVLVAMVSAGAWAAYRLLLGAMKRRRPERAAVCILALCLAVGVGMGAWGGRVIARAASDNAEMVAADGDALSRLSEFDVCVDVMPEIYRQRYGNVRRTVLGGDELARLPGATVLMDNQPEHRLFLDMGYKYVQISDAHALYVQQPEAVQALQAGGYTVSDYYDTAIQLDMEKLAAQNNLRLKSGGIVVEKASKTLTKGNGDDLFRGRYVAEFSLFLPKGAKDAEGEICLLRVGNVNVEEIASVVVTRDQFDSQGFATVEVPFSLLDDYIDVDFRVIPGKNRQVGVKGIRYWQTRE